MRMRSKSDSIDVMIEAARAYRRGRQMEQAIKVMDEAEELAIKADNLKQVLHCLTARATIFDDEKRYAEAAQAYARFLALARVPENASSKSWLSAVMSLSRCYKLLERYDEGRALAVTAWQQLDTLGSLEGLWGLAASVLEYNIKHCERWQAKTGSNVMADELVRWRERLAEYRALAKKHGLDEP
jgi:tetratricopeptide (TPR) repeat protein